MLANSAFYTRWIDRRCAEEEVRLGNAPEASVAASKRSDLDKRLDEEILRYRKESQLDYLAYLHGHSQLPRKMVEDLVDAYNWASLDFGTVVNVRFNLPPTLLFSPRALVTIFCVLTQADWR